MNPDKKQYAPQQFEAKWQARWQAERTFAADRHSPLPKYYVLDMFPYPSGAGLHVGHPLGYIASDILAKYKRLKGFNVLHPMGFDAFGLPAENYAIQTGQHPAITTAENTANFRRQLDAIGLTYDPDAWTKTSDPEFYRWTQWMFLQLFDSWYNQTTDRAEPIASLEALFAAHGNDPNHVRAATSHTERFTAKEWAELSHGERGKILLRYRLAYLSVDMVNWCPALGTVLSNDEVKDGVSERGGYPVERRPMRQWSLRLTAYAERLLQGLDTLDWPNSVVDMQRNWIGKSVGASITFSGEANGAPFCIEVFTTRPDTLFGSTFLVIAPEHELVATITSPERLAEVTAYVDKAKNRSERERQADVKHVSGADTGARVRHPFTGELLQVWVADYVLAGYGTGAIMAVPGHDERDWRFARHYGLPIVEVVSGGDVSVEAFTSKDAPIVNSDFLNGLPVPQAITRCISELEARGLGTGRTTYRLRDAIFARQRYWGEPIPMAYDASQAPQPLPEDALPLTLPEVERYTPTGTGESPLATVSDWVNLPDGRTRETNTMPGWAGSSWYFLRYLSPRDSEHFATPGLAEHWMPVDFYIGGAEHAVGHLLYARFWTQFLYDRGLCPVPEPFQRLVNQGMIQGRSNFVYKRKDAEVFSSKGLISDLNAYVALHVDVSLVSDDVLDVEAYRAWRPEFASASFELDQGKYVCGWEVEKMSKSKYNVVNPDTLCQQYGADTFRMYEMFLGPLEQSKPWNTNGITGVYNFLRKLWRLFYDEHGQLLVTDNTPSAEALKALHQTLKKADEDADRLSFNTTVPQFMICVNRLTELGSRERAILEPLLVVLSPFAPHFAEELWADLGHTQSIFRQVYPAWSEQYLIESAFDYPVSVNGKLRVKATLSLDLVPSAIEKAVLALPELEKWLEGKPVKKVVVVPGKIVNVVV
jgi:leucyl-tRNA synthetase